MFLMHRYLVQSAHNLIHQYTPSVHRQISSNLLQTHVVNTSLSFTDRWQSVTLPPSPSTISWLQMESMTSRGCLKSQRSACMPVSNENQSSIFLSCFSRQVVTRNLNRIIDVNHYPVPEVHIIVLVSLPGILLKTWLNLNKFFLFSLHQAEYSNKRHRPIGIGVQGLADAFILMRYPFESPEAQDLNRKIFETIYFGALTASCELAKRDGPYDTYKGSPVSKGVSVLVTTSLSAPRLIAFSSLLSPSSFLFPSFYSWVDVTHSLRSCNTICGKWLLLISGTGANSRLTLPSEYKCYNYSWRNNPCWPLTSCIL